MSSKSIILFTAVLLASFTCSADFQLTKDGKSQCSIVIKKDAPPSVVVVIGDLFVDVDFVDFVLVLMFWFCIKMKDAYTDKGFRGLSCMLRKYEEMILKRMCCLI